MLRGGNSSLALYTNYKMFFIRQKDEQMCICEDRVGMGTIVGEQFKLHTTTNTRQFGHKLDIHLFILFKETCNFDLPFGCDKNANHIVNVV